MSEPRCHRCRFWDDSTTDGSNPELSPCRVFAPIIPINSSQGRWPMVDGSDWCGQFQVTPPIKQSAADIAQLKEIGIANIVDGNCTTCQQHSADCWCVPF